MDYVIGAVVGAVLMDLLWAWRLGLTKCIWIRIKQRFGKQGVDNRS